jgi:glycosyltransferase involved in cell wall biosynthesis
VVSTAILNPPGHNQGVGEAMRRMFAVATGDPIIKIDQDLVFEDGWLANVNEILDTHEADVDAHPGVFMQAPRIGALGAFKYWHEPVHYEQMLIQERQRWTEVEDFVGSFIAVPRAVYEEFGPFQTHSDAFAEDVVFKKKLQAAGLVLGLPTDDIAHNQGFGIGPSTVVREDGVHKINKEPVLHGN